MTPVRVGVVGLGLMGRVHSQNANECGGRVVAGADIDGTSREEFARTFDVPTYESHDALLESEAVDAVVITTPNRFHEPAAVAALEAGCDVLVEKPLAHSLDGAERIAATANRSPGFCMVGFHSRFSPAATTARAYRDAGRFGEIAHIEATYVRRRGIPAPGSWFTTDELAGGGALIDIGVHAIDLALYQLGFPDVTEISGVARSNFGSAEDYANPEGFGSVWGEDGDTFDVDDSVSAFVRCATGQTIALEVAWATNRPPASELVVRGTEAGARFEFEGDTIELYEASRLGLDHYVTTEIDASGGPNAHAAEMTRFLEAAGAGEPPVLNGVEQGLAVQQVTDAIYRSSETGRACRVESPPREPAD